MHPRRFVLLDRDGTIIVERNYLADPSGVELLSGAADGLRQLRADGWGLVVVTNQSGVGRGFFTHGMLGRIHDRMESLLADQGVKLDGIYVCPHRPDEDCNCRKPQPGLALTAAKHFDLDLAQCVVIGDKQCDIDLGKAVGSRTALVRTGYGKELVLSGNCHAEFVGNNLLEISDWLRHEPARSFKAGAA